MRPRTPLHLLLLLVRLQLVLRHAPQYRSPDRPEQAVPDLVSAEAAGETTRQGAAEAAVGLLIILGGVGSGGC